MRDLHPAFRAVISVFRAIHLVVWDHSLAQLAPNSFWNIHFAGNDYDNNENDVQMIKRRRQKKIKKTSFSVESSSLHVQ